MKRLMILVLMCSAFSIVWPAQPNAALFVANRMGTGMEKYRYSFQDYLRAGIGGTYSVVSPETVVSSIQSLRANPIYTEQVDATQRGLLNSAGMQQLATMLDAKLVLFATLNSFTERKAHSPRFKRTTYTYNLKVTYQFSEAAKAAAFQGKVVNVSKVIPVPEGLSLQVSEEEILGEMLQEASGKIQAHIANLAAPRAQIPARVPGIPQSPLPQLPPQPNAPVPPAVPAAQVPGIYVVAQIQGFKIPEFTRNANGDYTITGRKLEVASTDASVFIDGFRVGTSNPDQKIPLPPGIHRIRVERTGFVSKEEYIRPFDGMRLHFVLEPTQEEVARWNGQLAFISGVRQGEKMKDAQVKAMEGLFNFLSNSKYETPDMKINQITKKLF
jgi:hypothetical protein